MKKRKYGSNFLFFFSNF
uniref:Uncharacterized protein n=1 Tax=Anguilla anguilla TaxID=7936 RepID=A0A0E9VMZ9_ANGAN